MDDEGAPDGDGVDRIRRGLVGAILGGVAAGGLFSPASSYLEQFAPLSGDVWRATTDDLPDSVSSPYGEATLAYDDYRVPQISADGERALYYAVGFAQGTDRLFQMDIQRRQMRGQISEVAGEAALASDEFHVKMDFARAADANWTALQERNPTVAALTEAFADGVNDAREQNRLPPEFELLGYEPAPWTPADTVLGQLQISWTLTGSFETLRRARLRDALGEGCEELFPRRYDHDSPILRGDTPESSGVASGRERGTDPNEALTDWLSTFESTDGVGSNSWVVSGDHTESGEPIVCNDPHLSLMAPPVWYQQHLDAAEYAVRGVTFPGVPFVIIGENHAGAWGFTNVGADVLDCYTYEIDGVSASTASGGSSDEQREFDGERYRYEGEWREFDAEEHTIAVQGGEDVTVTKRKTVHGPLLEREEAVGGSGSDANQRVGVAWTGLTATATTDSIYAFAQSDGLDDVREATRDFEIPTQNLVYADRSGNTYYKATGRIPIRRVDGEEVPGWRVFDGSAGEGEWEGFTPYGESSWDGFVPFDEKPGAVNPGYVATANQRVVDDPEHYLAESYSPPFRGERIYERLDEWTADGSVTPADMRDLQRDALDTRARRLVPRLLDAVDVESVGDPFAALADWDYQMRVDSEGALAFAVFLDAYREALYADGFGAVGLDDGYWPSDWVTVHLADDARWFDREETPESATAAIQRALDAAAERVDVEEWETYGDYNVVSLTHPFDQSFLNYPEMPTDGSPGTVNNFRRDSDVGSSWRMVVSMSGEARVVLPGGNDGDPFSEQYHDQLDAWAAGEFLPFDREFDGPSVSFRGEN